MASRKDAKTQRETSEDTFLQKIESGLFERHLFPGTGTKLLVAVSGGLDSMVLLDALHRLSLTHQWKLHVAHFNHQLRGRASNADERLVIKTANKLGLPITVDRGDVKGLAKRKGISIEMAARKLRHDFLARAARRQKIETVCIAHHSDDRVELFLLRALRGSGSSGLSGLVWWSSSPADANINLLRPLLGCSKSELQEYARLNRVPFREDATNAQIEYQRNRIRKEIIPRLKRIQPALTANVHRTMDLIRSESNFVFQAAADWLASKNRKPFYELHTAVQRRCIELQSRSFTRQIGFETIEHLRLKPDVPITISPSVALARIKEGDVYLVDQTKPEFKAENKPVSVAVTGTVVFAGVEIAWCKKRQSGNGLESKPQQETFDAEKVGDQIVLRHWKPGDRFQPIGMKQSVKLQDFFVNQKISRAQRTRLVLAETSQGEIFWVEGLRISERFKLTSETLQRLIWSWRR